MPQEDINELLVEKAREGKYVVRPQGRRSLCIWKRRRGNAGSSGMRGSHVRRYQVLHPAIAAPAAAGIPVTHRQCSRMVTILTASAINSEGKKKR